MKSYQDGKEYTRRQVIEYKDGENPEMPHTDATYQTEDMHKVIGMIRKKAVETLEAEAIPGAPFFYRCENSGRWEPAWERPETGDVMTVEAFVKILRYERDSPEDIAARILLKIYELERAGNREEAICKAFWFGFDVAMATIYTGGYTAKRGVGGNNSKKPPTAWGFILAEYMINQKSTMSAEQVYERLKKVEQGLTVDGWVFIATPDGRIQATKGGKTSSLEVDSFRKGYLAPLRRKNKNIDTSIA
jgi:hypothetical protein